MRKSWKQTALVALKNSAKHWERMRDNPDCEERPYSSDCACCKQFEDSVEGECHQCPISISSGFSGCCNTPWDRAKSAVVDARARYNTNGKWLLKSHKNAINKQISFLRDVEGAVRLNLIKKQK